MGRFDFWCHEQGSLWTFITMFFKLIIRFVKLWYPFKQNASYFDKYAFCQFEMITLLFNPFPKKNDSLIVGWNKRHSVFDSNLIERFLSNFNPVWSLCHQSEHILFPTYVCSQYLILLPNARLITYVFW